MGVGFGCACACWRGLGPPQKKGTACGFQQPPKLKGHLTVTCVRVFFMALSLADIGFLAPDLGLSLRACALMLVLTLTLGLYKPWRVIVFNVPILCPDV